MAEPVTVCIPGTRSYRAGVSRGWARANMLYVMDGVAVLPERAFVERGLPHWIDEEDIDNVNDYIDGYVVGFGFRVQGRWPNGMQKG